MNSLTSNLRAFVCEEDQVVHISIDTQKETDLEIELYNILEQKIKGYTTLRFSNPTSFEFMCLKGTALTKIKINSKVLSIPGEIESELGITVSKLGSLSFSKYCSFKPSTSWS